MEGPDKNKLGLVIVFRGDHKVQEKPTTVFEKVAAERRKWLQCVFDKVVSELMVAFGKGDHVYTVEIPAEDFEFIELRLKQEGFKLGVYGKKCDYDGKISTMCDVFAPTVYLSPSDSLVFTRN